MADDPAQPGSDASSQSGEGGVAAPPAGPEQPMESPGGVAAVPGRGSRIAPFDFRRPAFLAEAELRRLRLQNEEFSRYLSARLSLHLRMEFAVRVAGFSTMAYSAFCESLPNPTHLSLFKLEPLVGIGVLELSPQLARTVADRLLGGRGHSVKAGRPLTEIEIALIEDVLVILLDEWCAQWKPGQDLAATLIGHESSGRFLQTSPKDAIVLNLTLECRFGDCVEQLRIGVPYPTIEPLVRKLQTRRQGEGSVPKPARRAEWQGSFDRITVPVRAEWDAIELSVREITSLRVGDVIEMLPTQCHETRVLLGGTAKFVGSVGLEGDRIAIQLTRKLPSGESSHAKPDGRKVP
jgi:flagellar motor switch protein FliM